MNFHATRARDRAKCAESARTDQEFVADIYEAVAALRDSLEANEAWRDQQIVCTAILQACRQQMTGRLNATANKLHETMRKPQFWSGDMLDAHAAHDFNDES